MLKSQIRFQAELPTMEFHISRTSRDLYKFDETLFSLSGNVIFANFHGARVFAARMNQKRDLVNYPEQAVQAGQINAMGFLDEILHHVVALFREQKNAQAMSQALEWLDDRFGQETVDGSLRKFIDEFPPLRIFAGEIEPDAYLREERDGIPNRQVVLEELMMLWLANMNPAFSPFVELFDDRVLDQETSYSQIAAALHKFFETQPRFGPDDENLIDMLRSPAIAVPHSLSGQLEYIRRKWGHLIGHHLYRLLGSLDFIKEEQRGVFLGAGPAIVAKYGHLESEPERFSSDLDWMPNVVMLAKNAYVWLSQLAKKYQRSIDRLDQIPDEELDTLRDWGINALWLIGVWERSTASKKIKQMCGNPEAEASAYSLFDYQITAGLGGEEAFRNLKERAWLRGIRMAGDMVPNHVGIDAKWVVDHPDWFVARDDSPYPSYSFGGANLSQDERVGIYLEDHYFDRSDAAVAFRRVDHWTGDEKFIYHGNDGTSMPWNDTAQLNFLNPDVREAVIQTILHVARNFPIIRFDAAMTLAKKHVQRLWFPEPGTGGAIPSRAEHGMTKQQFDELMPQEFWREVVDRAKQEAPDTLLLAEAFWMLEGYFVRTLGMHRVYNSAFMNMLKNEDNTSYRTVMKNTLEFNPEILKRFVNFMNNPDEQTALAQFGKDDKYFGACTMMVTLPGLPMFGHGQVEGFAEKYGMEYRRAYWDEQPDQQLIQRHEREIFPLLRRRFLFSEVESFLLYDFFTVDGYVNDDVFAYSNRVGDERALVVYHNKFAEARGWIRTSAAYAVKSGHSGRKIIQKNLGEGLNLHNDETFFCTFRDHLSGREYIRSSKELWEKGLFVDLGAYKYHVFWDFREVRDNEWHHYRHLADFLDGRGVPSIDAAMKETFLQPIHIAFKELVNAASYTQLMDARATKPSAKLDQSLLTEIEENVQRLMVEVQLHSGGDGKPEELAAEIRHQLEAALLLAVAESRLPFPKSPKAKAALKQLKSLSDTEATWPVLFSWLFVHSLGKLLNPGDFAQLSRSWIDEFLLGKLFIGALRDFEFDEGHAKKMVALIKILTTHQHWFDTNGVVHTQPYNLLETFLKDGEVQQFLQVNRHQGLLWFSKESFEELLEWLFLVAVVELIAEPNESAEETAAKILTCFEIIEKLHQAEKKSEFQIEQLLQAVKEGVR